MEKKLFCPNCGTQLPLSAKFCNKCGCSIPSNENANSLQNTRTIEPNANEESKQLESVADNSSMDKEEQPKPLFSVSNIVRWVIVTIVALMINDGGIGGFVLAALCIGVDVLIRVFQTKYKWSLVKSSIIATLIGLFAYLVLNSGSDSSNDSSFSASSSSGNTTSPSFYYGTWSDNSGSTTITFKGNDEALLKISLYGSTYNYTVSWSIIPEEGGGVVWNNPSGEYTMMKPDGHMYTINKRKDIIDDGVTLKKQ